jgi:RNA polymerase sigma factor for flagellar operon FliA
MSKRNTNKEVALSPDELKEVWESYTITRSENDRHQLMLSYMWLVKYVVSQLKIPNNSILSEDDFINVGMLGLNEAISRFDITRGVKFESYAIPRIKGIIQDEMRKLDWLSRSTRKKAHDFLQAKDILSSQTGREVTASEIIEKLNISPEKYQSYLQAAADAKSSFSISESSYYFNEDLEDYNVIAELPDTEHEDYLQQLENDERIKQLTDFLQQLNEKKRLVMTLYYYENLTFKEIGSILNVSESRICQIHSQVLNDLREKLDKYENA